MSKKKNATKGERVFIDWKKEEEKLKGRTVSKDDVDGREWRSLEKIDEHKRETEATKKFSSPELLLHIHSELSKKHLFDDKLKMAEFIVCCTGYLEPHTLHKSMATKANRSEGKDNLHKTCVGLFPEEDVLFLTGGTVAALEDSIDKWKLIVYSEVNLQRDDKGANAHLIEVIKQMTEGGTSTLKKDLATGFKTTKHTKQKQKTVLYGTTETADDDELSTRFMIGTIYGSPTKTRLVNINTCNWFAGKLNRVNDSRWFAYGVKHMLIDNEVVIPFLDELPKDFFDCNDARSMRDVKRFLASVSAVAWVHQKQRQRDDKGRIIAEWYDFFATMIITGDFFNYTYSGMGDQRLQKCIEAINEILDSRPLRNSDSFSRLELQEKLGVTINTVKGYLKGVKNLSIVRYGGMDGNNVMYERCQKGVKRVLMGVNWKKLFDARVSEKGVNFPKGTVNVLKNIENTLNRVKNTEKDNTLEEIDTLKLTPHQEKTTQTPANTANCKLGTRVPITTNTANTTNTPKPSITRDDYIYSTIATNPDITHIDFILKNNQNTKKEEVSEALARGLRDGRITMPKPDHYQRIE